MARPHRSGPGQCQAVPGVKDSAGGPRDLPADQPITMRSTSARGRRRRNGARVAAMALRGRCLGGLRRLVLVAPTPPASPRPRPPSRPFRPRPSPTTPGSPPTTVSVGNVSTLSAGLFTGAAVGARPTPTTSTPAVGSTAARSWSTSSDDGYTGAAQQAADRRLRSRRTLPPSVASRWRTDSGGPCSRPTPGCPTSPCTLDLATADLPNSFSPAPAVHRLAHRARWCTSRRTFPERRAPTPATIIADLAFGHHDME